MSENAAPSPNRPSRARKLAPPALLLGSLLFSVVLAEIVLRVLGPSFIPSAGRERHYFCTFDPELGWAPLPNVTGRHERHGFSVVVHQNEHGLRGPDGIPFRGEGGGGARTLFLGDSYVWGYGVEQDEVFTAQDVHRTDGAFLNFGVSGYGTDQEYLLYERLGTSFEVDDVVLVLTPYNDIENNQARSQYEYAKPFFTLDGSQLVRHQDHIAEKRTRAFFHRLRAESRVINFFDHASRTIRNYSALRKAGGAAAARARVLGPGDVREKDREGVKLTVALIAALRDTVVAQGAGFSVVFVPFKPHVLSGESGNHPLVPLLAAGLAEVGIRYFEPYPEFREMESETLSLFNPVDNHFSPAGHRLFARVLTDSSMRVAMRDRYSR